MPLTRNLANFSRWLLNRNLLNFSRRLLIRCLANFTRRLPNGNLHYFIWRPLNTNLRNFTRRLLNRNLPNFTWRSSEYNLPNLLDSFRTTIYAISLRTEFSTLSLTRLGSAPRVSCKSFPSEDPRWNGLSTPIMSICHVPEKSTIGI